MLWMFLVYFIDIMAIVAGTLYRSKENGKRNSFHFKYSY